MIKRLISTPPKRTRGTWSVETGARAPEDVGGAFLPVCEGAGEGACAPPLAAAPTTSPADCKNARLVCAMATGCTTGLGPGARCGASLQPCLWAVCVQVLS